MPKRGAWLTIRAGQEELDAIRIRARQRGQTVSDYVRQCCLGPEARMPGVDPTTRPRKEIPSDRAIRAQELMSKLRKRQISV